MMSVDIAQVDDSDCRYSSQGEFPSFLSLFILTRIVAFTLSLEFLIICLWLFYFFIVGFEEFIGEVELIIKGVFTLIVFEEFCSHLFGNLLI
jgi:hypothetical protein